MSACLISVVTPNFVPGAIVMLHSFLRHNPRFDGDLLIFHKDLTAGDVTKLQALHTNVIVSAISPEMAQAAAQVATCRPELQAQQSSFYKGELLKLSGYSHIIMSDCDILYTGSIKPVLDNDADLQACGDGSHYRGERRSLHDYSRIDDPSLPALQATFSAGFVVLSSALIRPGLYDRYLAMMARYCEGEFSSRNTDQAIFNVLFDGKLSRLDSIYNYHLMHQDLIRDKTGRVFTDAIVLHYGGVNKPWDPIATLRVDATDKDLSATFRLWRTSYADYLHSVSV